MIDQEYDYTIAGAGCAGLSLAYSMLTDSYFDDKKILVIEKDAKDKNDRTWCHWSKEASIFDDIVLQSWNNIRVFGKGEELLLNIDPYRYKMIKGIDFYNHVIPQLNAAKNFDFVNGEINEVVSSQESTHVIVNEKKYDSKLIFKSFADFNPTKKDHSVIQHFGGWFVETEEEFFEEDTVHFMDFRTDQKGQTRFFYILPTSKKQALIEIAIFSDEVLSKVAYDDLILEFIEKHIQLPSYKIVEKELGAIPMTTCNFTDLDNHNIVHLGSAAGCIKPSSGFAFERIQDHTIAIIQNLKKDIHPSKAQAIFKNRFKFYDKIFMNVLLTGKAESESVFLDLFKNVSPQLTYKFLDEDTSFFEELKLFTAPPLLPFLKAFVEEVKP